MRTGKHRRVASNTNELQKYPLAAVAIEIFPQASSIAAIAMACMVDKGHITYDTHVSKVWPEYAKLDKRDTKLMDVLRHEAGMPFLSKSLTWNDIQRDSIKANAIGAIIEQTERNYPLPSSETDREYHAVSRGFILNEIFRRVHPEGKTIGEHIREEFFKKLEADIFYGLEEDELERVADLQSFSLPNVLWQSILPKSWGRKIEPSLGDLCTLFKNMHSANKKEKQENDGSVRSKEKPPPLFEGMTERNMLTLFGSKESRTGEVPSILAYCSARGMAKLAACMAGKGKFGDVRIMSEETVEKFQDKPKQAKMYKMTANTIFTQGGVNKFGVPDGIGPQDKGYNLMKQREGYVGWLGLGGSCMQWHSELKIGFGFCGTLMHWYDFANTPAAELQQKVVECVKNIQKP